MKKREAGAVRRDGGIFDPAAPLMMMAMMEVSRR